MEVTTTELLEVISQQQDQIAELCQENAQFRIGMLRHLDEHERCDRQHRDVIASLQGKVNLLMAREALQCGLLPERMDCVSLLAVQIFHKESLTNAERQKRWTNWSVKIEVSVDGRRNRGIDVPLYPGDVFADQVFATAGEIPPTIQQYADGIRSKPDVLAGMLKRLTSGEGTPRERRQFIVLRGHLSDMPEVQIWTDDIYAVCGKWSEGKGTKPGKAKWYGTCKPIFE